MLCLPDRHADNIPPEYARQFADSLPHLVWITGPSGELEFFNRRCLEYVGLPMAELLGWDWERLVHPDDLARTVEQWTRALQTGCEFFVENRLLHCDGVFRWHYVQACPFRAPDGSIRQWFGTCTEIDEQKRAKRALAAMNVALENAVEGIARLDADGQYLSVNPAYARMTGFEMAELVGMSWESTVQPDDREAVRAAYRQMQQSGRGELEVRGVRKDGSLFHERVVLVRAQCPDGGVPGHYCFMRDVTQTRMAAEALRASATRFRALIENSHDAFQLVAADGTILYASPAIVRTGGRTPEEVVGHKATEWSHPEDLVDFTKQFGEFVGKPGASRRIELRYQHKDGSWRWAEATCNNLLQEPAVNAIVVNVHDITDRKQAEEAVRASNELLQAVTEGTSDAVFVKDREGRYLLLNAAVAELFGKPIAELIGRDDSALLPGEVATRIRDDDLAVMAAKTARTYEETVPSPRGARVLQTSKAPYRDSAGAVAGVIGISRDVTERKRLEEQLRQAQKMEAVGRLAGGLAHDFNNLLTVINGYSEIILDSLDVQSPLRPLMEDVMKAGERGAGLTRQLLAFSRQQMLQPKVLDLNEVVAELCNLLRRMIGEDVELVLKPGLGLQKVQVDPGQIQQVLMNLAINARDAMPTGGTLTIETCNEEIKCGQTSDGSQVFPGQYVQLSVSDTGTGMTAEVRTHIFEPFFTTKENGRGTGLGLAMVYGIVQQSGGHIAVETAVGKGTTFRLYLPALSAESSVAKKQTGDQPLPRGTETVLVVEDEDAVRGVAKLMLEQLGYNVVTATCAEEAIAICQPTSLTFDLLLTDVVMPGKSGRTLAEELRAWNPRLNVLYMSGYTDDAIVRHGVEEDHVAFIQKPFSATALAWKVREVLTAESLTVG